jgi:hypothetical protein
VKRLIVFLPLFLVGACSAQPALKPDPNHTHADFAVWIDGRKVDFSQALYMSGGVTAEEAHAEDAEHGHEHLHPYLHLHDGVGHVIHRHKPGVALGEFFASLGMDMTAECFSADAGAAACNDDARTWRMFVNGEEWPYDPAYVFQDVDAILLTYGSGDEEVARQIDALTDGACLYSRTCPERGDPPVENCIADPAVPCVAPE